MRQGGFTLIELLAVLGILAVLAAIGSTFYFSFQSDAREARLEQVLNDARDAMEAYFVRDLTYEGATVERLEQHGFRTSGGTRLTILIAESTRFALRACDAGARSGTLVYESDTGALKADGEAACSPSP